MTNSYNDPSHIFISPIRNDNYVPFEYNRCHWVYQSKGKYQTECNSIQHHSIKVLKCPNCARLYEVQKKTSKENQ